MLADGSAVLCVVACGVGLIVAAAAFYVAITWLSRRLRPSDETPLAKGFTIETLETMRNSGQISEEEFARLRCSALGLEPGHGKGGESQLSNPTQSDDEKPEAPDGPSLESGEGA